MFLWMPYKTKYISIVVLGKVLSRAKGEKGMTIQEMIDVYKDYGIGETHEKDRLLKLDTSQADLSKCIYWVYEYTNNTKQEEDK